ncbi:cilia- and flagella-associated protein 58 isoform X1 [Eupeodes corollae]|uniref:cilia- and flagella-associated protein 58 isoform X1 n=1 Tax=Eupeodes corollae TaxID=290404 RepID=UPI002492D587|nr:cilia- and flagella-associated protein 58 isoform X1 [Eupeodes corollae]
MRSGSFYNCSLNTLNNSERSKNLCSLNKQTSLFCCNNNKNDTNIYNTDGYSDRESVASSVRGKRTRSSRIIPMKASKNISKKTKTMDYTNYAYNEAVGRLKLMLADSYAPLKTSSSYTRNLNNDDSDNFSDNLSVVERPVMSEISKYLSPSYKNPRQSYRSKYSKSFQPSTTSKENLTTTTTHYTPTPVQDYVVSSAQPETNIVQAPAEIFNFIEKQEDYIEQLEKESKFCRNELSNLLGKVKDVISENEALTDNARAELAGLNAKVSASSESEDNLRYSKSPKKREKSPRYSGGPSIVYESKISQLEAELAQSNIDLRKVRGENEDLKRKLTLGVGGTLSSSLNCETHRKQIETLQMDKIALEENIRQLQKTIDEMKASNIYGSSKRYAADLERSHSEMEVKHLREELDRQHERVRELQHEMARRIADERANAERRYNNQVDQLGGDLSTQWDQVTKLQLDLERQKRLESDLKRDLSQKNAQVDELKMELKANRCTFLSDIAQVSAEKQSLEQEITSLRLQLDRSERQGKVEASRLTAEISSLRQRLDRGDADLLHSKREVLRLNDEIANLEKELAYGEMKNEIRPTKKDLDKRISEIQEKHADTVVELEEMIQSQKQLMDKLTTECKTLTKKLEDTTLKNNEEKTQLRHTNDMLMERLRQIWASYKELNVRNSFGRHRSSDDASDVDVESCREEQLKNLQISQQHPSSINLPTAQKVEPLWTPKLSHLQPQKSLHPTAMKVPLIPYNYRTTILAANRKSLSLSPEQQHQITSQPSEATTTGMMKTKKTVLVREKNIGTEEEKEEIFCHQTTTSQNLPTSTNLQKPYQQLLNSSIKTITKSEIKPVNYMLPNQPIPQQTTTLNTPVTMGMSSNRTPELATINPTTRNTMELRHMKEPLSINTTEVNNSMTPTNMETTEFKTMNSPTNPSTTQHFQLTSSHHHPNSSSQHHQSAQSSLVRQYRPAAPMQESPRSLALARQRRAALNRDRAIALWGQQVQEQMQETNSQHLCHNSLPRQLKDYRVEEKTSSAEEMIDPLDLEFCVSSPSLFDRSCASSETDVAAGSESTEVSASPRTAIHKIT